MVAARLVNIKHDGDRWSDPIKAPIGALITEPAITQEQAAKTMHVSGAALAG